MPESQNKITVYLITPESNYARSDSPTNQLRLMNEGGNAKVLIPHGAEGQTGLGSGKASTFERMVERSLRENSERSNDSA